jgi:hypothetical protein
MQVAVLYSSPLRMGQGAFQNLQTERRLKINILAVKVLFFWVTMLLALPILNLGLIKIFGLEIRARPRPGFAERMR